jgi:hypothetical protein
MDESELVARYRAARDEASRLENELEKHFLPLVRQASTLEEAKAIARRIPDSVTLVFAADAIRQKALCNPES